MVMLPFRAVARSTTLCIVLLSLITQFAAASTSTLNDELLAIDEQLLDARNELLAVVEQMREAKQVVAEKHEDVATYENQYAQESSPLAAGHLRHARQRLALAKMGVDTGAARFERIQRKMEDLAAARIQLLSSRDNQANVREPSSQPPRLQNDAHQRYVVAAPQLEVEGKLDDPIVVEKLLMKLEQYLINAAEPRNIATNVKAFGSIINGEIALLPLGGNQFFTRFTATRSRSQVVIGARLNDYIRTSVDLQFSEDEMGREFILLLDLNSPAVPRAVVFDSAFMRVEEALAVSQRF